MSEFWKLILMGAPRILYEGGITFFIEPHTHARMHVCMNARRHESMNASTHTHMHAHAQIGINSTLYTVYLLCHLD